MCPGDRRVKHLAWRLCALLLILGSPGLWLASLAWGANGDIVFSQEGQIRSINPSNGNEAPITSDDYFNTQPSVSPNGQTVAYARLPRDQSTPNEIYTVPIAGGTPQPLVTMEGADIAPAWSRDGTEVAFAHQEPGDSVSNIYKINIATKIITQLTNLPDEPTDAASGPAWSADGSKIAFIESTDSSGFGVAVMDSDGSDAHKIVPAGMAAEVAWSPFEELFYSLDERTSTSDFQIYRLLPNGSTGEAVTDDSYEKPAFAISPDGSKIVFVRSDKERELAGSYSLWTMAIDGSNQSQLTSGHDDANPTWAVGVLETPVTLTSTPDPAAKGAKVKFTAKVVASTKGAPAPTGTVTFLADARPLETTAVSKGKATLSLSSLPVGSHEIVASYSGDSSNKPGRSLELTETVTAAPTKISCSSSANPARQGSKSYIKAVVRAVAPARGVPVGTVTFKEGSDVLAVVTLERGVAKFPVGTLAVGEHVITASYEGGAEYVGAEPVNITQAISP